MSKEEKAILADMAYFLLWSIREEREFAWALSNLGHDIGGCLRQDLGFQPRTIGYAATYATA